MCFPCTQITLILISSHLISSHLYRIGPLLTDGQLSYGTSSHPDAEGGVTLVTLKGPSTHVSAFETQFRTDMTDTTLTCGRGSGAPFTISRAG